MIKRLRIKFVLIIMGVVLIMLGIIFGLIFYFTRAGLETESLQMMRAIASEPFLMEPPGQMERPEQNVRLPYFVLHVGPDGELHATNGGYYDLTDQAFLESVASEAVATGKQHGVISDYDLRFYKQETPGKQCLVFADISSERATLESMARTCAAIGALSLLAFLGISVVLSKWAVRPIEQAWEQQRQFVADASHELKTPLAVILTNAELANSGEYAEEERGQFIRNILIMSGHMKLLVEQMLELSRTDRTPNRGEEQTVDLSGVIANVALTFEASL
ncbi:MAG: sensor histidine kinase, partial [Ruminiclostridium sp.]|nr:sensor histidine kinase [Ruminiclostridium sp.]